MPGLIKNLDYDTAIIGSSMTENYRIELTDELFKVKSALFPIVAASGYEIKNMIQHVFNSKDELDQLFVNLDFFAFSGEPTRLTDPTFPLYLYDQDLFNDIRYLINEETLRQSFKAITKYRGVPHKQKDLWYWSDQATFSKQMVIDDMLHNQSKRISFNEGALTTDQLTASFDFNILPFLIRHPNTKFNLIFPPYSNLIYVEMDHKNWFTNAMGLKKHIVDITAELKNVKIYDFQCVDTITGNLDNYKDLGHHSAEINDYILQSIHLQKHRLTTKSVDQCIEITNNIAHNTQWKKMYETYMHIK